VHLLEIIILGIVALFLAVRVKVEPNRPRLLRRLGLLSVASWIGEDTMIRAYHFYQYSPRWSLVVDEVPLLIVVIWPIVIISAWDLVVAFTDGRPSPRTVVGAAAMVFADAYLIEPIAVASGLWSWNEPGLFEVPPIGVLGWSLFAGTTLGVFALIDRHGRSGRADLLVLVFPVPLVHAMLLAAWWGALRWVNAPIPDWVGVATVWLICATLAALAWRHPTARRVARRDLLIRIPAAAFFFVLLGLEATNHPALVAYSTAFALPYLTLTIRSTRW